MKIKPYTALISTQRHRLSSYSGRSIIVESESDRGRVVFSNSFRRLQQKAQVFPLESNAAVRNRLTHSLEVAHIGKYLAQRICSVLKEKDPKFLNCGLENLEIPFVNIVETACLIHDIGNPPFGHFGEVAICDWFSKNGKKCLEKALKKSRNKTKQKNSYLKNEYFDFIKFDGNPQGLRVISKLNGTDGKSGLNLTYSQIAAYLKYGCLPQDVEKFNRRYTKAGFFNTEKELVECIWNALNMTPNTRHPLAYLMEAADDIAYCMSDFEDGMEKGILAEEKFEEMLRERWDAAIQEDPYNQLDSKDKAFLPELLENASDAHVDRFIMFKTSLINSLIDYAVHQYLHNHNKMLDGTGGKLFKKGHKEYLALKCIKEVVLESVFRSREAESVELAGYSTIYGLLKHFSQLLEISAKEFKCLLDRNEEKIKNHGLDIHRRLFNRLSGKAVRAYEVAINNENVTEIEEWHFRGHLIVDYISGMTDDFALQTYQLLSGIKVEIN